MHANLNSWVSCRGLRSISVSESPPLLVDAGVQVLPEGDMLPLVVTFLLVVGEVTIGDTEVVSFLSTASLFLLNSTGLLMMLL